MKAELYNTKRVMVRKVMALIAERYDIEEYVGDLEYIADMKLEISYRIYPDVSVDVLVREVAEVFGLERR